MSGVDKPLLVALISAMREITRYRKCFVCGDENPQGLAARFYFVDGEARTEIDTREVFEGYRGIYHGGIIATLLDEVMIKALLAEDIYAVTAEMTVKFKRPVRIGERVHFAGRLVRRRGRACFTAGEAVNAEGRAYAVAEGKYVEADPDLRAELLKSIE
jgi:uncharacterized protein (TIGR00369 family)